MDTLIVILFVVVAAAAAIAALLSGPTYGVFGLGVFPRKRTSRSDELSRSDNSDRR
jgi:hypothetical protein